MATLTFQNPDGSENQFDLAGELSVGREAGNDVVLPEGGLSRKHCRFFEEDGQVMLEDLQSSNGTFVDGERIEAPTPVSDASEILVANIKVVLGMGAKSSPPRRQAPGVRQANASNVRTGAVARPAAIAKRNGTNGASKPPVAGGRNGASGSSSAVAKRGGAGNDAVAEAGSPSARGTLRGQTGPWAGKKFQLVKPVTVIGRVAPADVVIEDDSISRKHAEVRKSGSGYMLKDLESANGTYLNGEKITEAPLRPGDTIKFGVVEFSYSGPALARGPSVDPNARRKKLLMIGGGSTVGLLLLGLTVHELTKPPPDNGSHADATGFNKNNAAGAGEDVAALLGQCKAYSDTDGNILDWDKAIQACEGVLKLDPINVDARKIKKESEYELGEKKIFDKGHNLYNLSQEEDALEEYVKIDEKSYYYRQCRAEFKEVAPRVLKRQGDLCVSLVKNGSYEKAWPQCKAFMDIGGYLGVDDTEEHRRMKSAFDECYRTVNKGKPEDFRPREDFRRFIGGSVDTVVLDRAKAIKAMYPDSELGDAVDHFARDPAMGINLVQHYLAKGGKDSAKAKQVQLHMTTMYSKHEAGYGRMLKNDLKNASEAFKIALSEDAAIMPKGMHSDIAKQDIQGISDKWAAESTLLFGQKRYPESYAACANGSEFSQGSNPAILECFTQLENLAATLATGGCGDSGAGMALKISKPESPSHKTAQKYVDEHCK